MITACTIARDEASNLSELLPSLRWADEVLVVLDADTQDESAKIAASLADRVETRPFISFPSFRNLALELAAQPWVIFVDADERVSETLVEEIRAAVDDSERGLAAGESGTAVAYWVPRLNIMFGRLVRGGGWFPDHQLRLLHRERARYDETQLVHEVVQVRGPTGYLEEPLLHLNYQSLGQFFAKQRRYTAMEVETSRARGDRPRRRAVVGQPMREFGRRYLALGGWKDGPVGLFLAVSMAYYSYRRVCLLRTAQG